MLFFLGRKRIFQLQLQFYSWCCVGINYCDVTPLLYRILSFQNLICNHFVQWYSYRSGLRRGNLALQGARSKLTQHKNWHCAKLLRNSIASDALRRGEPLREGSAKIHWEEALESLGSGQKKKHRAALLRDISEISAEAPVFFPELSPATPGNKVVQTGLFFLLCLLLLLSSSSSLLFGLLLSWLMLLGSSYCQILGVKFAVLDVVCLLILLLSRLLFSRLLLLRLLRLLFLWACWCISFLFAHVCFMCCTRVLVCFCFPTTKNKQASSRRSDIVSLPLLGSLSILHHCFRFYTLVSNPQLLWFKKHAETGFFPFLNCLFSRCLKLIAWRLGLIRQTCFKKNLQDLTLLLSLTFGEHY